MRVAAETFAVPMVGGHTNLHSPYNALSVAVLGSAPGPVLSARAARPGDLCHLLINTRGRFHRHYPFWDAATDADPVRLRRHLALLVELAAARLVHAAKDISMGGLVGTAVMFAEAAGCRLELDLATLQPPEGWSRRPGLTCFPSFGYLLAWSHPDQRPCWRPRQLIPLAWSSDRTLSGRPCGSGAARRTGPRPALAWAATAHGLWCHPAAVTEGTVHLTGCWDHGPGRSAYPRCLKSTSPCSGPMASAPSSIPPPP